MTIAFVSPTPLLQRSATRQLKTAIDRCSVVNKTASISRRCYVEMCAENEDAKEPEVMQGPTQAPTEAGVSTVGLSDNEAAFIEACYATEIETVEKYIDEGVDISVTDVNGRTALHFLAGNGVPTLCRKLLDLGADINKQDLMGLTPLHMATGYKMAGTVKLLVEAKADANIANYEGQLPVEMAEALLAGTPKKRFFMKNAEYEKLEEIVGILDKATEEEEEEAELAEGEERTEEVDGAKFVVRVKPKGEDTPAPAPIKVDDVQVTIRVKEPEAKK